MSLRVILTTGGTGGHIFPALAVAEALKKLRPDIIPLFIGGAFGPEKRLVEKENIAFVGLPVKGFLGKGLRIFSSLGAMSTSIGQAMNVVREFKPHATLGFGGYAAFAAVFASWLLRVPCAIHEQNAIPGQANKILGKMASKIFLSWPQKTSYFPASKCVHTGNPIRSSILSISHTQRNEKKKKRLLVMGGSQGASAINDLIISILPDLKNSNTELLHQTGDKDFQRVRSAYLQAGFAEADVEKTVLPFIDDMASAYANSDLAFCRAGATTMAELAIAKMPAVFIPFPYAVHDHQTRNAEAMEEAGGAVLLPQSKADELAEKKELGSLVLNLISDEERLAQMRKGADTLARPNASEHVAQEFLSLIKQ